MISPWVAIHLGYCHANSIMDMGSGANNLRPGSWLVGWMWQTGCVGSCGVNMGEIGETEREFGGMVGEPLDDIIHPEFFL